MKNYLIKSLKIKSIKGCQRILKQAFYLAKTKKESVTRFRS